MEVTQAAVLPDSIDLTSIADTNDDDESAGSSSTSGGGGLRALYEQSEQHHRRLVEIKVEKATAEERLEDAEDKLEDAHELAGHLVQSEDNKMTEIGALKAQAAELESRLAVSVAENRQLRSENRQLRSESGERKRKRTDGDSAHDPPNANSRRRRG